MSNANKSSSAITRYGGFFLSVGAARLLGLLVTSVTFPILVRRLGVQTYGSWSYVVALCAFFDIIANPGLTTHASQQVAARRHAAAELVGDFLALRGLGVIAAIVIFLVVVSLEGRPEMRSLLRWYGVAGLCVSLTGSDFFLTSLELFHTRSLLALIQQSLYAAGVIIFVRSPKDLLWLPASILGSALITNLAGWIALWRNGFRPALRITPRRWRSILVPSFHYAATSMMSTIYHRTGHLAVRWFLGEYALGLYAAAVRFVDILRNFVSIGLGILMPRMALAAQSQSGLRRLAHAAVSALAGISIPLMLGTLATVQLVLPWVLGTNYLPAVELVRWMSPYLLAAPMASLLSGTILYAMGRHRAYLTAGTAGALVAVLLSFTLGRRFGLPGICVSFVLAEVAVAVTAYCLIPRDLRDLWKNPVIAVATFASLLMLAAVYLTNYYSSQPLLIVAVAVVVYAIVSAMFGRKLLLQQLGDTT
jgi:O-antigen/teichoic acid export membrane protein